MADELLTKDEASAITRPPVRDRAMELRAYASARTLTEQLEALGMQREAREALRIRQELYRRLGR